MNRLPLTDAALSADLDEATEVAREEFTKLAPPLLKPFLASKVGKRIWRTAFTVGAMWYAEYVKQLREQMKLESN